MLEQIPSWAVFTLISLLTGLFWRQLAKNDADAKEKQAETDQALKAVAAQVHVLEVEMAKRITRDDMDEVFRKIETLSNTVIAALGHRGQS